MRHVLLGCMLLASQACASTDPVCAKVDIESVGRVDIRKELIVGPMIGGGGPRAPAIGLVLNETKIPANEAVDLVRLSLWPITAGQGAEVRCERSTLLKKPVVACTAPLRGGKVFALMQYALPSNDEINQKFQNDAARTLGIVQQAVTECSGP